MLRIQDPDCLSHLEPEDKHAASSALIETCIVANTNAPSNNNLPVARAEPAVEVTRIRDGYAAQVGADADHDHELGFEAPVIVRFLIAKIFLVDGHLPSYVETLKPRVWVVTY